MIEMVDLPLAPGSAVFVNGAAIAMTPDGKLRVQASARVLTKDQLMIDASSDLTPTKRIYLVLQAMLLDPSGVDKYRRQLMDLVFDRSEATTLPPVMLSLANLLRLAEGGDYHAAMDICQKLIDLDDALIKQYPVADR